MPRAKRDHNCSLKVLCCCCGRKPGDGKVRPVKEEMEPAISKFIPGYTLKSNLFPQSICGTCRKILAPLVKDLNANVVKPPVIVDWTKILPSSSRSSGKAINNNPGEPCPCGICDIARLKGAAFQAWHKDHSRPPGTPRNPPIVKNLIKRCGDCQAEVERGKSHSCNKTEKRANLTGPDQGETGGAQDFQGKHSEAAWS